MDIIDIALSRKGGGNVPVVSSGGADWDAVEGENGYIANKPFGGRTYRVFYEDTITISSPDPSRGQPGGANIGELELVEGSSYTVTLDGDVYEVEFKSDQQNYPPYLGNLNACIWFNVSEHTDEPFVYIPFYKNIFSTDERYLSKPISVKIEGFFTKKIEPFSEYLNGHLISSGIGLSSETFNNLIDGSTVNNTAVGEYSHAEGYQTVAVADCSHAEGVTTRAGYSDVDSSSGQTITIGEGAHAEGYRTLAAGDYSHAEGMGTLAGGRAQHAGGFFNIPDDSSLEIIGNGADENDRSNARTLDRNGNEWLAGGLTVSSTITIGSITISEYDLGQLLALLPIPE